MSLNQTPRANRIHIGIFGKRNSGKSSLINALTGQSIAMVSEVAGTTTDPVYKAMEIHGIGPCMLIDTAGFDDHGVLGTMRVEKTKAVCPKVDLAVMILGETDWQLEQEWAQTFKENKTPMLVVLNKIDRLKDVGVVKQKVEEAFSQTPVLTSISTGEGIEQVKEALIRILPEEFERKSIMGQLVSPSDCVLLVMPQDIQAPKGRLILPQVQTIRDLLDNQCLVMCITTDQLDLALESLKNPPKWIVTDSQIFQTVYEKKPKESLLTSFSILFAAYKGDLETFVRGARALNELGEEAKILIAEACTHAPLSEDIGREKIPRMLRQKMGKNLRIDHVSGVDFPKSLSEYDLIIHCGACMFNRKYVLSRIQEASRQGVPISNYGVVLAQLTGVLDEVTF